MKVCILSMQKVQNLGSIMQGYSLKKLLESLGHEVEFIDIEARQEDNELMPSKGKMNFEQEGLSNSFFSKLKKVDKYLLVRIKQQRIRRKQYMLFEKFRCDILGICEASNKLHYDYCIIGSDEVFNCMQDSPWGFTSQLFGNVSQADHVITYAASCGFTKYEYLNQPMKAKIKEAMKNISAISVRDKNTREFAAHFSDLQIYQHMDPVMIGNFDAEIEAVSLPTEFRQDYCLIYAYGNRISSQNEVQDILSICRKEGLSILTVAASYQLWTDSNKVLTPFQILKAFKSAKFVITDTFHGTIFSIKYADRFAVLMRESNKNKLSDLIERLNIENHVYNSGRSMEEIYHTVNEHERIWKIEYENYQLTKAYFQKYIM